MRLRNHLRGVARTHLDRLVNELVVERAQAHLTVGLVQNFYNGLECECIIGRWLWCLILRYGEELSGKWQVCFRLVSIAIELVLCAQSFKLLVCKL